MKKSIKAEKLYMLIWTVYSVIYAWAGVSALPDRYPFIRTVYSIIANGIIIILFFLFLILKKYTIRNFVLYVSFIFLVFLLENSIADRTLLISIMFVINAFCVNVKKLISFDIKLKIALFVTILLFCICGITENLVFNIFGINKQALGFNNPNMFAAYTLTILVEWLCLHYGEVKKYQYLLIFILWYMINDMSRARTSAYTFLIVLLLFILADFKPQIFYSNIIKILLACLTPLLAVLSFLFTYLYVNGNTFAIIVNRITTNRVKIAAYALARYDIKLLGQPIAAIDNAYVHGVLHYGLIFFVLLCFVYSILFIKLLRHGQINMVLLGVFYVVTGLGEKFMYSAIFNVSLLYLLYTNDQISNTEYHDKSRRNKIKIHFSKA